MRLQSLVEGLGTCLRGGEAEVTDLVVDSRQAKPGAAFLAQHGAKTDSHAFIAAAYEKGARAFIVEVPDAVPADAAVAVLPDTRRHAFELASRLAGHPADALWIAGITGTNGKTSTTYLLEAILEAAGHRTGVIGTVNTRYAGEVFEASNTTPGPLELVAHAAAMRAKGVTHLAMEVSSHALDQGRVQGLPFDAALFTNLTRDHLDYHATMDAYAAAKRILFADNLAVSTKRERWAIVNADDAYAEFMLRDLPREIRCLRYGLSSPAADWRADGLQSSLAGSRFTLHADGRATAVHTPLIGAHNVDNVMQALALAVAAGVPLEQGLEILARGVRIPGRLERVPDTHGRHVFVDYAHTPDALDHVQDSLLAVRGTGRLLTVFGCGGDRDHGKRPLMGLSVAERSDLAIATSDNPRTEVPADILAAIVPGLERGGKRVLRPAAAAHEAGYLVIEDRAEAIRTAVRLARTGDIVLIAGKGHETYQLVGREVHPFDDVAVAQAALKERA